MMHHVQYKGDPSTCHQPELTVLHAQHLWEA